MFKTGVKKVVPADGNLYVSYMVRLFEERQSVWNTIVRRFGPTFHLAKTKNSKHSWKHELREYLIILAVQCSSDVIRRMFNVHLQYWIYILWNFFFGISLKYIWYISPKIYRSQEHSIKCFRNNYIQTVPLVINYTFHAKLRLSVEPHLMFYPTASFLEMTHSDCVRINNGQICENIS